MNPITSIALIVAITASTFIVPAGYTNLDDGPVPIVVERQETDQVETLPVNVLVLQDDGSLEIDPQAAAQVNASQQRLLKSIVRGMHSGDIQTGELATANANGEALAATNAGLRYVYFSGRWLAWTWGALTAVIGVIASLAPSALGIAGRIASFLSGPISAAVSRDGILIGVGGREVRFWLICRGTVCGYGWMTW